MRPTKVSKSRTRIFGLALTHIVLIAFSITFLVPIVWMLSTSLKPLGETMTKPPTWVPSQSDALSFLGMTVHFPKFVWSNYPDTIKYGSDELHYIPFLVYAKNSLIVTLLSVGGAVFANTLVAYSF